MKTANEYFEAAFAQQCARNSDIADRGIWKVVIADAMRAAAEDERERCAKYVEGYRNALKGRESTADVMFILGYIAKSLRALAPVDKGDATK